MRSNRSSVPQILVKPYVYWLCANQGSLLGRNCNVVETVNNVVAPFPPLVPRPIRKPILESQLSPNRKTLSHCQAFFSWQWLNQLSQSVVCVGIFAVHFPCCFFLPFARFPELVFWEIFAFRFLPLPDFRNPPLHPLIPSHACVSAGIIGAQPPCSSCSVLASQTGGLISGYQP